MKRKLIIFNIIIAMLLSSVVTFYVDKDKTTEVKAATSFEEEMRAKGFPDSYIPYLSKMHTDHPTWIFEAVDTSVYTNDKGEVVPSTLDWNTLLQNEMYLSRKLVPAEGSAMSLGLMDVKDEAGNWEWYQTPTAWKAVDEIDGAFQWKYSYQEAVEKVAKGKGIYSKDDNGIYYVPTDGTGEYIFHGEYAKSESGAYVYLGPNQGNYKKVGNDWVRFDTGAWVQASKAAISFMMDPRNWLNDDYIFMFEKLAYVKSRDTVSTINTALKGTFMYNAICPGSKEATGKDMTYAQVIVESGKSANVSALHLATRIMVEKGTQNDVLGKGVILDSKTGNYISATEKQIAAGKGVYYNYFNIGACGGNGNQQIVINNGAKEAISEGWTSPYLAIMGGGQKVYNGYLAIGQDTIYFEMYSVVNPKYYFWKQYAGSLFATTSESSKICTTYRKLNITEAEYVFKIPVYKGMPESACPMPASPTGDTRTTANPNYKLSSIVVNGINSVDGSSSRCTLSPTFNSDTYSYTISVPYKTDTVEIKASAIASTSSVTGTGTKELVVGKNVFNIVCKSAYGTKKIYKITINREEGSTLLTKLEIKDKKFTTDFSKEQYKYESTVSYATDKISLNYKAESTIAIADIEYKALEPSNPEDPSSEMIVVDKKLELTNSSNDVSINDLPLMVGENKIKITIYASAKEKTSYSVYELSVVRLGNVKLDLKAVQVNGGNVNGFELGQNVAGVKKIIPVTDGKIVITSKDGVAKKDSDIICTGDYIKVYDVNGYYIKQYRIIIYGDTNGDGIIDIFDFAYIRREIIKGKILTGIWAEAANVSPDSAEIDIYDFAIIRRFLIKNVKISQTR